jgi:hypothetical protein
MFLRRPGIGVIAPVMSVRGAVGPCRRADLRHDSDLNDLGLNDQDLNDRDLNGPPDRVRRIWLVLRVSTAVACAHPERAGSFRQRFSRPAWGPGERPTHPAAGDLIHPAVGVLTRLAAAAPTLPAAEAWLRQTRPAPYPPARIEAFPYGPGRL